MLAQTYTGPVHWIIVDDGPAQQEVWFRRDGWEVDVYRPEQLWRLGQNTQQRNLQIGLGAVDRAKTRALMVIEDDDYYGPEWLQFVDEQIEHAELIGEGWAIYYNVYYRTWDRLNNDAHCSLRCSAMRGAAIDTFESVLSFPNKYYDQQLWKRHPDRLVFPRLYTVGIKGMPGRAGIAIGHDRGGNSDPELGRLDELIGPFSTNYRAFREGSAELKTKLICVHDFEYAGRRFRGGDIFDARTAADAEVFCRLGKVARVSSRISLTQQQEVTYVN